ncbi:MAG: hypothetical protein ACREMD_07060 [Gemmatimonadota bacterium]
MASLTKTPQLAALAALAFLVQMEAGAMAASRGSGPAIPPSSGTTVVVVSAAPSTTTQDTSPPERPFRSCQNGNAACPMAFAGAMLACMAGSACGVAAFEPVGMPQVPPIRVSMRLPLSEPIGAPLDPLTPPPRA